jgi:hypothetical protein
MIRINKGIRPEEIRHNGNPLQGKDKVNQVVKNLLKKDISKQPPDFRELKRLVEARLFS